VPPFATTSQLALWPCHQATALPPRLMTTFVVAPPSSDASVAAPLGLAGHCHRSPSGAARRGARAAGV